MNLTPFVIFGLAIASTQIASVLTVCTSTGSGCLSATASCQGRPDGDYQACEGCTFYHSCGGGVLYPNRPCALTNQGGIGGRLVWRAWTSNQGICDYTSSTCTECVATAPPPPPPTTTTTTRPTPICTNGRTGPTCITASTSCVGKPDGDYQACESCTVYHSCSGGVNWSNRPCARTNYGGLRGYLVWNSWTSNQGICDYTSSTCAECPVTTTTITPSTTTRPIGGCTNGRTGPNCITASTSCVGKPDGDYQACESCTVYHSCSGGVNWSNRPCARTNYGGLRGYLVWNSWTANRGICDYTSSTCAECNATQVTTCNSGTRSGTACITRSSSSCSGRSNGDYQACEGCTFYHTCSNGINYADRPCARRNDGSLLVWVTDGVGVGHCDWSSTTCSQCN